MLFSGTIEKTIAEQPDALPVLKLHYLRWLRAPDLRHAGWDLPADQLQELVARRRLGGKQPSQATPSRC